MKNKFLAILAGLLSTSFMTSCKVDGKVDIPYEWVEGFDPVLEYKGDIDVVMYIVGQQRTWTDVGMPGKYAAGDIIDGSQALFFAAAREFKKLYPDIRINVHSGGGNEEYIQYVTNYVATRNHVPHVMHHVEPTPVLLTKGLVADLSQYKNKFETYNIINPELMKYFNYGGFQAAVPYGCFPTGLFINYGALDKVFYNYENLTEEWTVEKLNEIITIKEMSEESGGIVEMHADWMNFIPDTLFKQYQDSYTLNLDTPEIRQLLDYEHNWYNYSAFDLTNHSRVGTYGNWQKSQMFVEGAARVLLGRSWSMGTLAQMASKAGVSDDLDFYPWPSLNEDTEPIVSLDFGAINVGNQCPVGSSCSKDAKLAQEAAAYFAMFMVADSRSIQAASKIEWNASTEKEEPEVGTIKGFPVVSSGAKLSFLDNDDEYETQLGYFFDNYPTWKDKPGFTKVLELYRNNKIAVCSEKVNPFLVPFGAAGSTKNILEDWNKRYEGDGTLDVSSSTWTGWAQGNLAIWTSEINANADNAWGYLTEQMCNYYDLASDFDAKN